MRDEEDIEKKIEDLTKAINNKENKSEHFKTVYESQVYILKWVLGKNG